MKLPTKTRALVIRKVRSKPVYHNAVVEEQSIPDVNPGELLVRMSAAAFNHREVRLTLATLWQRKGLYPAIVDGSTFGADGAGTVIASADPKDSLLGQRVFLTPARGWESDPIAPESMFGIVGGGPLPPIGTFSEYVVVERDQVILTPSHLSDVQAAAWPLGGLTAWRAVMINGCVEKGQNVLITGVGGGVALFALQLCVAAGANVYVTSGSKDKIDKAVALGARGGVNYKDKDWPKRLEDLLSKGDNPTLDVVIDSAGGPIVQQTSRMVKHGGRFVCYGMTVAPTISLTMREVMQNMKLLGSTMGSHKDMLDATRFLEQHRIVPIVSHVLHGLEHAEEGFELMEQGAQFGKIVVKIDTSGPPPKL
ncbi:NAD-P-binding protein [Vararia minispora EC-137]|uniref:NAD-P-binding protein n=1 Tax=Vararia minispora EC-137 TaxID=1314806 RepID=A0ACB8QSJ1_9AGAM|nr:NAD-P-binding protein [Vararia minispora EC-137]